MTEIFSEVEGVNEIRGLLAVSCPGGSIAAVTLRQNDDPAVALLQDVGTLTAFPVLVGTP